MVFNQSVCAECSLYYKSKISISNETLWLISEWRNKKHYNIQTVKISNFCSLNIALINSQSDQHKDRS